MRTPCLRSSPACKCASKTPKRITRTPFGTSYQIRLLLCGFKVDDTTLDEPYEFVGCSAMFDDPAIPHPVKVHCGNSNRLVGGSDAGWPLSAVGPCHGYSGSYQIVLGDLILDREMQVGVNCPHRQDMIATSCNPCNVAGRINLLSKIGRDELVKARYISVLATSSMYLRTMSLFSADDISPSESPSL